MPEANFDHVYDPVATPNPAYDDDCEPTPERLSSWDRRGLAQALLARARARQEAIADAFIDALLEGKISLFRLLIDLEQAAVAGEAEAQQAHLPTLTELLIPMLDRERKQAAENAAAAEAAPGSPSQSTNQAQPATLALSHSNEASSYPGTTDLNAAAEPAPGTQSCRSYPTRRHGTRSLRAKAKTGTPPTIQDAPGSRHCKACPKTSRNIYAFTPPNSVPAKHARKRILTSPPTSTQANEPVANPAEKLSVHTTQITRVAQNHRGITRKKCCSFKKEAGNH